MSKRRATTDRYHGCTKLPEQGAKTRRASPSPPMLMNAAAGLRKNESEQMVSRSQLSPHELASAPNRRDQ